jgi:hypothetical protein
MGRIQLEVIVGKKGNSHREPIWFEVVDISSPYHMLLGRSALAKFMAMPHYAYFKMKLLGPHANQSGPTSCEFSLAAANCLQGFIEIDTPALALARAGMRCYVCWHLLESASGAVTPKARAG